MVGAQDSASHDQAPERKAEKGICGRRIVPTRPGDSQRQRKADVSVKDITSHDQETERKADVGAQDSAHTSML